MNGLPYYKAYPRDFVEGTIGMPFEVKCAYRVVIDLIYMQGGQLPDDPRYISGHLGCSIRKWKSIRADLVSRGKIVVSGEFLTNNRADKELETLAKLKEKQAENARGPRENNDLQKPRQSHTEPEPEPEPEVRVDANASTGDLGFDEFWSIIPNKTAKQNARKAWRKLSMPDRRQAFAAVRDGWFDDWQRRHPQASMLHPATFLNQRRWEDQPAQQPQKEIYNEPRSVTERLAARFAGMDQWQDRDASEPFPQHDDQTSECGGGCYDGLDQGAEGLFSGANIKRLR